MVHWFVILWCVKTQREKYRSFHWTYCVRHGFLVFDMKWPARTYFTSKYSWNLWIYESRDGKNTFGQATRSAMQTGTPTAHALKETGTGSSPGVKSQRLDICQMWSLLQITNAGMFELELLGCFNTLCMCWNWLILKPMHFFALDKREADVNSLDCWCPPLTVLQE